MLRAANQSSKKVGVVGKNWITPISAVKVLVFRWKWQRFGLTWLKHKCTETIYSDGNLGREMSSSAPIAVQHYVMWNFEENRVWLARKIEVNRFFGSCLVWKIIANRFSVLKVELNCRGSSFSVTSFFLFLLRLPSFFSQGVSFCCANKKFKSDGFS